MFRIYLILMKLSYEFIDMLVALKVLNQMQQTDNMPLKQHTPIILQLYALLTFKYTLQKAFTST